MQIGPKISSRPPHTSNKAASVGGSGIHPCAAWVMAAWKSKILLSALNGNMTTRQSRARKARKGSWVMARSVAADTLQADIHFADLRRGGQRMSNPPHWLFLDQPDGMAIGIAEHQSLL